MLKLGYDIKYLLLNLLIALIILSTLVNNSLFGNLTLTAYFVSSILISIFGFIISIVAYTKQVYIDIHYKYIFLIFFTYTIYIGINEFIVKNSLGLSLSYMLSNLLLLISTYIFIQLQKSATIFIFRVITFFAFIESIVCFFQWAGFIRNPNKYFEVSGTWINPNVTAMFIAMALPAAFFLFNRATKKSKIFWLLNILALIAALILLKCRTALVGLIVASGMLLNIRFSIIKNIKQKFQGIKKVAIIFAITLLVVIFTATLYKVKVNSANGRALIWKISTKMIGQKILLGYGYGMFEHDYNLAQGHYFEEEKRSDTEIQNASFVKSAYNEFLQNLVEGGLLGFFLFTSFLGTILWKYKKHLQLYFGSNKQFQNQELAEKFISYVGVIVFIVMSFFNFTIAAIPVMCVFVLYISNILKKGEVTSIDSSEEENMIKKQLVSNKWAFVIPFFIVTIITTFNQVSLACAYYKSSEASKILSKGKVDESLNELSKLENSLKQSDSYWFSYGRASMKKGDYGIAIIKFRNALTLTSSGDVYMMQGKCYELLEDFKKAEFNYQMVKNMQPNKILPRFALMSLYMRQKDTTHAVNLANEIIRIIPKRTSNEAIFYKKAATILLNKCNKK